MSEENSEQDGDKSHAPSQQRLQKSRKDGDVPYSNETTLAAVYVAFFIFLISSAGWSAKGLLNILASLFSNPADAASLLFTTGNVDYLSYLLTNLSIVISPIFVLAILAIAGSVFGQQALVFAPSKLKPKMSRINVIANAKQKYGPNGIAEFLRSFMKLASVLLILSFMAGDLFRDLPGLSGRPASLIMDLILRYSIYFCGFVTIAAVLIAAIDLPWRKVQHENRLKMSLEELKKESKESEGDPMLKQERRHRAETIATNKMLADVPKADIVITNPTHYAVAIAWNREGGGAPLCVAKGVDETAARIREIAAMHGVPLRRDPPTARSIFKVVDVGQEIKREHFAAIAAAIHYADQLRKKYPKKP